MSTRSSGGHKAAGIWQEKGRAMRRQPLCEYCEEMRCEPGYRACSPCRSKIRSAIREDYSYGLRDVGRRQAT